MQFHNVLTTWIHLRKILHQVALVASTISCPIHQPLSPPRSSFNIPWLCPVGFTANQNHWMENRVSASAMRAQCHERSMPIGFGIVQWWKKPFRTNLIWASCKSQHVYPVKPHCLPIFCTCRNFHLGPFCHPKASGIMWYPLVFFQHHFYRKTRWAIKNAPIQSHEILVDSFPMHMD